MLTQNQRMQLTTATPNPSAFAMCPAALLSAWAPTAPSALPPMYAYAFHQAQRIVAADRFRRFEAFHMN